MPLNPVIKELVKNFRGQAEAYLSPSYNETQLRRDFLDKVIKALGWDVDNESGYHESCHLDVVVKMTCGTENEEQGIEHG